MYKTILVMILKAIGVILALVALGMIADAVLNSGKTKEFRDNLKEQ